MRKPIQPANGVEIEALERWRAAHPIIAMRTLADAGYTIEQRAAFLRTVVGITDDVADFASDSYIAIEDS